MATTALVLAGTGFVPAAIAQTTEGAASQRPMRLAQAGTDTLPTVRVRGAKPKPAAKPRRAVRRAAPRVVRLRPAPAPPPQIAGSGVGQGERATGPVRGYVATRSATATKTDTPILETPQSISVVAKDQITAQQTQTLADTLRYTPGVTLETYTSSTIFDIVTVRGFQVPVYLDGLRLPLDPATTFAQVRLEPYGMERVEVFKGPSSGLYGQTSPGGLINAVSKRPTERWENEVFFQTGSFDRLQGGFDLSGPLDKDGQFLGRVVGLVRDSGTQLDFAKDNRLYFAPSFTWRPNIDTSFTILANVKRDTGYGPQHYVPGVGTLLPNPNGRLPYSRYIGEPGFDGYTRDQLMIGYAFEHRINDVFQFRQNFRYTDSDITLQATRTEGLLPDLRTSLRSANYVDAYARNIALDNQLQADFRTGPLAHKVLFGIDYFNIDSASDYRFAMINPIDIFNPVYGLGAIPPKSSLAPVINTKSDQDQLGFYLQDQIKLDRFILTLTGRQDFAVSRTDNRNTGVVTTQNDQAFTGRAGLTYVFDSGIAPYVVYATSFNPTLGTTLDGNPFKPTTGETKEIGVKFQPPGTNALFTAAVFETTQQNTLTPDPRNPFFSVQTGAVRVQGLELEGKLSITDQWDMVAGYSHLDPRVTQTNVPGGVGKYVVNVAIDQASLWNMYTFRDGPLAGLGIGGGVRYVGRSYADTVNAIEIPDFTLFDAALKYDFAYLWPQMKGMTLQINATNIFNRYYVSTCVINLTYCGLGSGRQVLATLRYRW